jgi:hypothetical protein
MLRAKEIIGDRTPAEELYDAEVLRGLRAGADIRLAIASANATYPAETLTIDYTNAGDVAAHYEYLLEHEKMMMSAVRSPKPPSPRAPDKNATMAGDDLAVLRRIGGSNLDKIALLATCEKLDGIGREKAEPILKRLKKDDLIFGESREGRTYYALTVSGKACLYSRDGGPDDAIP